MPSSHPQYFMSDFWLAAMNHHPSLITLLVIFLSFLSDNWDSVGCPGTRISIAVVLAMCWGTGIYLVLGTQWYFQLYFLIFLFFSSIKAANDCELEPVAYEFFTQAYILYEEEISVSLIKKPVLILPPPPTHKIPFLFMGLRVSL